jgi:hypothetical protein
VAIASISGAKVFSDFLVAFSFTKNYLSSASWYFLVSFFAGMVETLPWTEFPL